MMAADLKLLNDCRVKGGRARQGNLLRKYAACRCKYCFCEPCLNDTSTPRRVETTIYYKDASYRLFKFTANYIMWPNHTFGRLCCFNLNYSNEGIDYLQTQLVYIFYFGNNDLKTAILR